MIPLHVNFLHIHSLARLLRFSFTHEYTLIKILTHLLYQITLLHLLTHLLTHTVSHLAYHSQSVAVY
jgi:hypothetical protein